MATAEVRPFTFEELAAQPPPTFLAHARDDGGAITRRLPWVPAQLFCLALFLLQASPAAAQPTPLTLSDAVSAALASDPTVAAAAADVVAAEHRLGEAEAGLWPVVKALGAATEFGEAMPVTPIHGFGPTLFPEFERTLVQGSLQVDHSILEGGARRGRIAGGEADAGAARAGATAAGQAVAAATAAAYLRALTLEESRSAHARRLAALAAEVDRAGQRFAAGRAAEVELRRAEAALAAARAEDVRLAAEGEVARADLARWTGRADATASPLAPAALASPDLPDAEGALARALAASPTVAVAAGRLASAEAALAVARALPRPKLKATAAAQELGSTAGSFDTEWNAGLQLTVPIWAGGLERERIAAAEAVREAAAQRVEAARREVAAGVDRALASAREAAARATSLAAAEAAFAEVARIESLRLDAGAGTQTDYLAAEAELFSARARLVEARHAAVAAQVELARLAGELSPAWFDERIAPAAPAAPREPVR